MYALEFDISNKTLNNLIKLEVAKHTTFADKLSSQSFGAHRKKQRAANIMHLAHIIGVELTLKDAQKATTGKKIITEDIRGIILNNFRNVFEYIDNNKNDSYMKFDQNLLIHLNKLLISEWKESWEAKIRSSAKELDDTLDDWTPFMDKSIEGTNIQTEIIKLSNWYNSEENDLHPILKIAIVFFVVSRLMPLKLLNKLTIISLVEFLLTKEKYTVDSFVVTTRIFDQNSDKIKQNLQKLSDKQDITTWLELFTELILGDIMRVKDIVGKDFEVQQESSKQPFLHLNKRQLKILKYLQTIPTVKREDYVQMMEVSTMTAFRDLKELVQKKLIKIEGKGRGTKYMLLNR